jgi:hypothetical protein
LAWYVISTVQVRGSARDVPTGRVRYGWAMRSSTALFLIRATPLPAPFHLRLSGKDDLRLVGVVH